MATSFFLLETFAASFARLTLAYMRPVFETDLTVMPPFHAAFSSPVREADFSDLNTASLCWHSDEQNRLRLAWQARSLKSLPQHAHFRLTHSPELD